jgi:hypothetical protein
VAGIIPRTILQPFCAAAVEKKVRDAACHEKVAFSTETEVICERSVMLSASGS